MRILHRSPAASVSIFGNSDSEGGELVRFGCDEGMAVEFLQRRDQQGDITKRVSSELSVPKKAQRESEQRLKLTPPVSFPLAMVIVLLLAFGLVETDTSGLLC